MANENIQELKFQVGEAWKGVYSSSTAYGLANVVQDPTDLSIYRSLKSGNVGHPVTDSAWWFCIIDLSSIKEESDRIAALNEAIAQDEALRVAAEELRQQHEAERVAAETQRNESEQARISAEQARVNAESARATAEQQRITAEQGRVSAESSRVQAEQARALAETLRANAEDQRAANEQNRVAAEQQRIDREQARETQYASDHSRAEQDHETSVQDNAQMAALVERADDDHEQAAEDHTRAESDHTTATSDHTQAGSDHTTAAADHTQAGQDHTQAESDHTRAESDHAAVEVYVDSLGAFDISAYHATGGVLAKYADLTAALGTNGANIPEGIRKGGMSVKFVQSSDNKYVQFRCMSNTFTTDVSHWQGVESKLKDGSSNLATSGAIKSSLNKVLVKLDGNAEILYPIAINKYRQNNGTESLASGFACTEGKIDITEIKNIVLAENSIEYPIFSYQLWSDSEVVNFANGLLTYNINCESLKESYPTAKYITITFWDGSSITELTDSDVADFKLYDSDYDNSYNKKIVDLSNSLSNEIERSTNADIKFDAEIDKCYKRTFGQEHINIGFLANKYRSNAGELRSADGFACTDGKVQVNAGSTILFAENGINYPIFSYQVWDNNNSVIAYVNDYSKYYIDCTTLVNSYPNAKYVTLTFWKGSTAPALTNADIADFILYYYTSNNNIEDNLKNLQTKTKEIEETVKEVPVVETFEINKYRSNTGVLRDANGFVCTHGKIPIEEGMSICIAANDLGYPIFAYQAWESVNADSAIGYENFNNDNAASYLDYSRVLRNFPTAKYVTLTFWDESTQSVLTQEDISDFALFVYAEGGPLTKRVEKLEDESKKIFTGYLFGKKIVTLCDSMGASSQWQEKLANITGATYNKSLNDNNYSFGGSRTLDANQEGNDGQSRAKKLVDDGLITPDIIIYENVNDINGNSGIGTPSDESFFRTSQNKLSLSTIPSDRASAIDYWNNHFSTIVDDYTPAAGTIIGVPYKSNNSIRLTITSAPTNSGNLKISVSTETKYIAVSAGESIDSVISKILECSWLNYIDDEDSQVTNSILFSLVYGNNPSLVVDANGTGITSTVTANVEGVLYYWKYFYGHDLSNWTDSSYWKDSLSRWSQWKGVVEYLQTSFKYAHILWLLPATYDYVQNPLPPSALYPDGSVNYMYLYENGCQYNELYEQQRDLCEKYQIHVIDLPKLAGINPMNASEFCNSGNVHPKQVAYDRWAEIIAVEIN